MCVTVFVRSPATHFYQLPSKKTRIVLTLDEYTTSLEIYTRTTKQMRKYQRNFLPAICPHEQTTTNSTKHDISVTLTHPFKKRLDEKLLSLCRPESTDTEKNETHVDWHFIRNKANKLAHNCAHKNSTGGAIISATKQQCHTRRYSCAFLVIVNMRPHSINGNFVSRNERTPHFSIAVDDIATCTCIYCII